MTDFRLVKTFFVYHTEGNCMRKKDIKNLTNISVNQGAVSILERAFKNRQIFRGSQGVKTTCHWTRISQTC